MQTTPNYSLKKPDGTDVVNIADLNANADVIDAALTPTADPAQTPTNNGPGKLVQWVSWIANRIKAITGKANWWEAPATTLEAAKQHMDAAAPHSGHVLTSDVVSTPTANKILRLNADGKLPTSITGDAATVGGVSPSGFAPASHIGAGGSAHTTVTTSSAGFMSAADKAKLDGIAAGAEPNQNAYSNILVNGTTISADQKQDTLELVAGANIALTPDPTNDKVTIAFTGTISSRHLYAGDESEMSASGTAETTIKTLRGVKSSAAGLNISKLSFVATLKVSGGTGYLKIYVDGALVATLSTTSTGYALVQQGPIAVSWADNSVHTIEARISNSGSYTTYNQVFEVYVE